MAAISFTLDVSHSQVAVFDSGAIRLLFIKPENPAFKILRADSALSVGPDDLLLSASPA